MSSDFNKLVDKLANLFYHGEMFKGNVLKGKIKTHGYSYKQVADLMGVHYNTIVNWANGRSSPTPEQLLVMLREFGCNGEEVTIKQYWEIENTL